MTKNDWLTAFVAGIWLLRIWTFAIVHVEVNNAVVESSTWNRVTGDDVTPWSWYLNGGANSSE